MAMVHFLGVVVSVLLAEFRSVHHRSFDFIPEIGATTNYREGKKTGISILKTKPSFWGMLYLFWE